VINIKKNTNYGYFNVSQHVFLRYRIADDFVYVVMKRHLCVESRLSALSAAILTSNGLIVLTPSNAPSDRKSTCVPRYQRVISSLLPTGTQPGSHRLNRSISPLDVNIAALRADNLDSTHRWRFITT
jgi:hypothetical protein